MDIYANDVVIGDFRASNYGLMVGSMNYSKESEDDSGITVSTIEEFIGENPVPVYISQKYDKKLQPAVTLVKNPCTYTDPYFTEFELRGIIRQLQIGKQGYVWMYLYQEDLTEETFFRVRVRNIKYQRLAGRTVGIVIEMECDSQWGYGREQTITVTVAANNSFPIYLPANDDLNNYLLPTVTFKSSKSGTNLWELTNESDNNWESDFKNVALNETLTFDCQKEIVTTTRDSHKNLLNDFTNLHWMRLVPLKNIYKSSLPGQISFTFRPKIRVGFSGV